MINNKANLFEYGTSELTQDAVICYLLTFSKEDEKSDDNELKQLSNNLLHLFYGDLLSPQSTNYNVQIKNITRQKDKIDIFIELTNGEYIIIEDKTFTATHHDQINRYYNNILKSTNVIPKCVYYKIVAQSHEEPNALNICRENILDLLKEYNGTNEIVKNYREYLQSIDIDENAWKTDKDNASWRQKYWHVYRGFFTHLIHDNIVDTTYGKHWLWGWGYVPNQSKGFWGLWWFWLTQGELLKISDDLEELYLQIEDDKIAVKIKKRDNNKEIKEVRWKLYEFFAQNVNGFTRKKFANGKTMTIGYINYNISDYREKIEIMENAVKLLIDRK